METPFVLLYLKINNVTIVGKLLTDLLIGYDVVGAVHVDTAVPLFDMVTQQSLDQRTGDAYKVAAQIGTCHIVAQSCLGRQYQCFYTLHLNSLAIYIHHEPPLVTGQHQVAVKFLCFQLHQLAKLREHQHVVVDIIILYFFHRCKGSHNPSNFCVLKPSKNVSFPYSTEIYHSYCVLEHQSLK